jgi:hypothetical protein
MMAQRCDRVRGEPISPGGMEDGAGDNAQPRELEPPCGRSDVAARQHRDHDHQERRTGRRHRAGRIPRGGQAGDQVEKLAVDGLPVPETTHIEHRGVNRAEARDRKQNAPRRAERPGLPWLALHDQDEGQQRHRTQHAGQDHDPLPKVRVGGEAVGPGSEPARGNCREREDQGLARVGDRQRGERGHQERQANVDAKKLLRLSPGGGDAVALVDPRLAQLARGQPRGQDQRKHGGRHHEPPAPLHPRSEDVSREGPVVGVCGDRQPGGRRGADRLEQGVDGRHAEDHERGHRERRGQSEDERDAHQRLDPAKVFRQRMAPNGGMETEADHGRQRE